MLTTVSTAKALAKIANNIAFEFFIIISFKLFIHPAKPDESVPWLTYLYSVGETDNSLQKSPETKGFGFIPIFAALPPFCLYSKRSTKRKHPPLRRTGFLFPFSQLKKTLP
jgi:hypothetical protein